MNPITLMKAAPWFFAFFLALLLALVSNFYLQERDAFTEFKVIVAKLGEEAREEKAQIEAERNANLEKVRQYEKDLPAIRAGAVAAYRLRFPNAGRCELPGIASGIKLDDGASQKQMDVISDCGDDANKLEAWQEWATLNKIPVKE